jgi:uncharacterized membrane protein YccC
MNPGNARVIDSFLFTNIAALRIALKVSVSVWGAFVIALLCGFEHPLWAMITGMISFFGAEHAQVMKKCIYQGVSTVLGGVVGLFIMSSMTQSPWMAACAMATSVFVVAALSSNSRDLNFTFCCAIFVITVHIIVLVPVVLTPTTATLLDIFIDRVGTVGAGAIWASIVSAALWPLYSSDTLRVQARRLTALAVTLSEDTLAERSVVKNHLDAVHDCMMEMEDTASHSDFEGPWGRRSASLARAMNRTVLGIADQVVQLQRRRASGTTDGALRSLEGDVSSRLSARLATLHGLLDRLTTSGRRHGKGMRPPRHHAVRNSLLTGTRSAILFLTVFSFWIATGWAYGFLIGIVPLVFSIMFAKLPHSGVLVVRALIGSLLSIPVGLVIFTLVAQAPSAVEMMLVTAGPVLFVGLMGLSSPVTFPYSLGFCLNFMIFLLPQNIPVTDAVFAIERTFAVSLGLTVLAILFNALPPLAADRSKEAATRMARLGLDVSP